MRYYGSWGPVQFQSGLRLNDAHVICRTMGYNQALNTFSSFQEDRGSYEVHMYCEGFENTTEQCRKSVSSSNYGSFRSIWIVCKPHAGILLALYYYFLCRKSFAL